MPGRRIRDEWAIILAGSVPNSGLAGCPVEGPREADDVGRDENFCGDDEVDINGGACSR